MTVVPDTATVTSRDNLTLVCSIDEMRNFTWEYNYQPVLPSNVLITTEDRVSRLTIIGASSSINVGRYTCIASGGSTGITSSVDALIDVHGIVTISPIHSP